MMIHKSNRGGGGAGWLYTTLQSFVFVTFLLCNFPLHMPSSKKSIMVLVSSDKMETEMDYYEEMEDDMIEEADGTEMEEMECFADGTCTNASAEETQSQRKMYEAIQQEIANEKLSNVELSSTSQLVSRLRSIQSTLNEIDSPSSSSSSSNDVQFSKADMSSLRKKFEDFTRKEESNSRKNSRNKRKQKPDDKKKKDASLPQLGNVNKVLDTEYIKSIASPSNAVLKMDFGSAIKELNNHASLVMRKHQNHMNYTKVLESFLKQPFGEDGNEVGYGCPREEEKDESAIEEENDGRYATTDDLNEAVQNVNELLNRRVNYTKEEKQLPLREESIQYTKSEIVHTVYRDLITRKIVSDQCADMDTIHSMVSDAIETSVWGKKSDDEGVDLVAPLLGYAHVVSEDTHVPPLSFSVAEGGTTTTNLLTLLDSPLLHYCLHKLDEGVDYVEGYSLTIDSFFDRIMTPSKLPSVPSKPTNTYYDEDEDDKEVEGLLENELSGSMRETLLNILSSIPLAIPSPTTVTISMLSLLPSDAQDRIYSIYEKMPSVPQPIVSIYKKAEAPIMNMYHRKFKTPALGVYHKAQYYFGTTTGENNAVAGDYTNIIDSFATTFATTKTVVGSGSHALSFPICWSAARQEKTNDDETTEEQPPSKFELAFALGDQNDITNGGATIERLEITHASTTTGKGSPLLRSILPSVLVVDGEPVGMTNAAEDDASPEEEEEVRFMGTYKINEQNGEESLSHQTVIMDASFQRPVRKILLQFSHPIDNEEDASGLICIGGLKVFGTKMEPLPLPEIVDDVPLPETTDDDVDTPPVMEEEKEDDVDTPPVMEEEEEDGDYQYRERIDQKDDDVDPAPVLEEDGDYQYREGTDGMDDTMDTYDAPVMECSSYGPGGICIDELGKEIKEEEYKQDSDYQYYSPEKELEQDEPEDILAESAIDIENDEDVSPNDEDLANEYGSEEQIPTDEELADESTGEEDVSNREELANENSAEEDLSNQEEEPTNENDAEEEEDVSKYKELANKYRTKQEDSTKQEDEPANDMGVEEEDIFNQDEPENEIGAEEDAFSNDDDEPEPYNDFPGDTDYR